MKKSSIAYDQLVRAYRIDYYRNGYRSYDYTAWWLVAQIKRLWFLLTT